MKGRITVYYFNKYLQPILSSAKEITADPEDYQRAVAHGMYAICDTQRKPQPPRYERRIQDAWRDGPVQKFGGLWAIEHDGAITFVSLDIAVEMFRDNYKITTTIGEIG